jgi:ubiquitin carboxyl-terminal hydrolase 36/42
LLRPPGITNSFSRYLIESLQRGYLQTMHAPKNLDNTSKETTPFNQIFGGYLRQDVTCLRCKHVSITFQRFMDVLLDIRQASNIEDALAYFFRAERIGGSGDGEQTQNMYKCERCKAKVPAKKKCFIERPPVVLCIQLKRFSLQGGKISKPVALNRRIDALQHVKKKEGAKPMPPLQYKLVSMITHVGPSPNCGHYTAIGEAGNAQFFQFDDSSVRLISANQALNTASYVVFYEMTSKTKQSWIDGDLYSAVTPASNGASNGIDGRLSNKPATVTSASSNGHHPPPLSPKILIGPQLPKAAHAAQSPAANKIGVVRSLPQAKPSPTTNDVRRVGLVPYDNASSDDEDVDKNDKAPSVSNGHASSPRPVSRGAVSAPSGSGNGGFVPRSVTMNALKRNPEPRPATPNTLVATSKAFQELRNNAHSSSLINGGVKSTTAGGWKVTDTETHNPSENSNNSTGSTSSWKVTPSSTSGGGKIPTAPPPPSMPPLADNNRPQQKSLLKSNNPTSLSLSQSQPSTPLSVRLNSNGGLGSPERPLKRGSSIEEYEADLDRGRTKKVKKQRAETNGTSFNSSGYNPFQNYNQGRHSPIFLQFFYLFSIFFLNRF